MTLIAREMTMQTEAGSERRLYVACPQRIDPTPITECAQCELCEGLDLDSTVSVRCAVEPVVSEGTSAGAPVSTIMSTPAVTVGEDAVLENVQWLLLSRNIGAVPVVDRNGRAIGIVAKTDLLRDRDAATPSVRLAPARIEQGLGARELDGGCARDVMTPVVHALLERASIAAAAALMAREKVHHVVVVDERGGVRGMVSSLDVVRWVAAQGRFAPREIR